MVLGAPAADRSKITTILINGDDEIPLNPHNRNRERNKAKPTRWQKYSKIVLVRLGLVAICIFYTVGGATVFYLVERSHEKHVKLAGIDSIRLAKIELLNNLWAMSGEHEMRQSDWRKTAEHQIDNMTKVLFDAFADRYISIEHILHNESVDMWTFPAAIFFATTTISTVGYGDLVPRTSFGRVFCVIFGLFGIPLALVTIADFGKFCGDGLVMLYEWYRNCGRIRRLIRRQTREQKMQKTLLEVEDQRSVPVIWLVLVIVGYTCMGAALLPTWERWNFLQSFYFSFITMSTIGFGDLVPQNQHFYVFTILYILLGLSITTMCVDLVGTQYIRKIHNFGRTIKNARHALRTVGDLVRYTHFLRRRYNLSDDDLKNMIVGTDLEEFLNKDNPFTPAEINRFDYIDQTVWTGTTSRCSTILKMEDLIPNIDDPEPCNNVEQNNHTEI